jgi:predicted dehydrogenase
MKPVSIGVIGCGAISDAYFGTMPQFPHLKMQACADLDRARAQDKATKWAIPQVVSVDELIQDPGIELVINLTVPQAHAEVDRRCLLHGKHVYSEKPMCITLAEADELITLAQERKLRIGCAPDTQLCGSVQTARALIDAGVIGRPIAAHAYMWMGGHETWHPNPEFYYLRGGGPMLDMGPYYIAALVTMLGPIERVAGLAKRTWNERTITSAPKKGTKIPVEVDTHIASILEFAEGAVGTLTTSFDVRTAYTAPYIEIMGELGSIALPSGKNQLVRVSSLEDHGAWREVARTHPYEKELRGVGVADMAMAIRSGRAHRANGEFARHTLAVMLAAQESGRAGRWLPIPGCERPAPMARLPDFQLDP